MSDSEEREALVLFAEWLSNQDELDGFVVEDIVDQYLCGASEIMERAAEANEKMFDWKVTRDEAIVDLLRLGVPVRKIAKAMGIKGNGALRVSDYEIRRIALVHKVLNNRGD